MEIATEHIGNQILHRLPCPVRAYIRIIEINTFHHGTHIQSGSMFQIVIHLGFIIGQHSVTRIKLFKIVCTSSTQYSPEE